jgi:putative tryptophan/tyrosine transport system substrate-binding protein
MRRRDFIASVLPGAAAMALPFSARAQQPVPVIGFLHTVSSDSDARVLASFRQGLNEAGFVAGRTAAIEFRWAEGHYDRLPQFAADLASRQVAVIVTMGGSESAQAAKNATKAIPIVFVSGGDPVHDALVASLDRPGGNVTGISWMTSGLEGKRLGLLHEAAPDITEIAVLVNPSSPAAESQLTAAREAARERGMNIHALKATSEREFEPVFASLVQQQAGALLVSPDPFFFRRHKQLVALATRYAIPVVGDVREYAAAGGLMSYGSGPAEAARLAGVYAGRILRGEKPADLPVLHTSKFELVVNLKTAAELRLKVPAALLDGADEIYK